MRDPSARLRDILDAISAIERYATGEQEAPAREELVESWIVRHLQIIGEAARTLPQDIRDRAPSIPWADIIGMRHILVHAYFGVDMSVIRDVVERDLPGLKRDIEALLQQLDAPPP